MLWDEKRAGVGPVGLASLVIVLLMNFDTTTRRRFFSSICFSSDGGSGGRGARRGIVRPGRSTRHAAVASACDADGEGDTISSRRQSMSRCGHHCASISIRRPCSRSSSNRVLTRCGSSVSGRGAITSSSGGRHHSSARCARHVVHCRSPDGVAVTKTSRISLCLDSKCCTCNCSASCSGNDAGMDIGIGVNGN